MAKPFALTNDTELKQAVRDATSYQDAADELPATQLDGLVAKAKRRLYGRTGSDMWYDDINYGRALEAWACIEVKAAVENIHIESYSIADETISLRNATRDQSQQLQLWLSDAKDGIAKSDVAFEDDPDISFSNTSAYIG
jgi:hypothetical protein